ncbi:MAG: PAS domain S-box protein [Peptococcaceae bacterium]|nr:MAG: PAS domain S-box protein [Peptococcaceae bacterium]
MTIIMPAKNIILDSIADGVFTVDRNWRITYFNRAAEKITGVAREKAVGSFCREVFQANICETECALKTSIEKRCPIVNKAVYIVNASGKKVPISISTAILKDEQNQIIGGAETFRDLTLVEELRKVVYQQHTFADIISKNHQLHRIFGILPDIAKSESTVLIEGPTGSGKELLARAIHNLSSRQARPLITVNCAALPDTLLESELFGYEAGAFTGARKSKPGRFARAEKGTLFLDEIGDISPALQVKLLRVLQEKEYEPLGATRVEKADVRIIAATNKNLARMIEEGSFREDLYYRLNVIKIGLPPLSQRREDIPLLIEHFINRFNTLQGKSIIGLTKEAYSLMLRHDFPGNIRELENIIEHAFIMCKNSLIAPEHLPASCLHPGSSQKAPPAGIPLTEIEARVIYDTLVRNNWRRLATARELGINKTTLWRKMKRYNINKPAT